MVLDKSFISDLKAGKAPAFRKLVLTYQDQVVNTCYGFVQHREEAEDLAQEVFLEVVKNIGRFRGEAKLSTWMYRVAVNKSLDYLRQQQRKKRSAYTRSLEGVSSEETAQSLSVHATPQQHLEQQERQEILFHAIAQLSQKQRVAFTLHKVEGLSYQEVGEVMGLSNSSIESLIHRAKKNLKKRLFVYYRQKMI